MTEVFPPWGPSEIFKATAGINLVNTFVKHLLSDSHCVKRIKVSKTVMVQAPWSAQSKGGDRD